MFEKKLVLIVTVACAVVCREVWTRAT